MWSGTPAGGWTSRSARPARTRRLLAGTAPAAAAGVVPAAAPSSGTADLAPQACPQRTPTGGGRLGWAHVLELRLAEETRRAVVPAPAADARAAVGRGGRAAELPRHLDVRHRRRPLRQPRPGRGAAPRGQQHPGARRLGRQGGHVVHPRRCHRAGQVRRGRGDPARPDRRWSRAGASLAPGQVCAPGRTAPSAGARSHGAAETEPQDASRSTRAAGPEPAQSCRSRGRSGSASSAGGRARRGTSGPTPGITPPTPATPRWSSCTTPTSSAPTRNSARPRSATRPRRRLPPRASRRSPPPLPLQLRRARHERGRSVLGRDRSPGTGRAR